MRHRTARLSTHLPWQRIPLAVLLSMLVALSSAQIAHAGEAENVAVLEDDAVEVVLEEDVALAPQATYEEDAVRTDISDYYLVLPADVFWYTGKQLCPTPRVYAYADEYDTSYWDDDDEYVEDVEYEYYGELQRGVDYTVSYANNINAGTAKLTVTGIGKYQGSISKTFPIRHNIARATVSAIKAKTYSGKKITPKPKVTYGGKRLKLGTDYTLTYRNNKSAGTARVTIKGKGTYAGSKAVTFKIKKKSIAKTKVAKVGDKKCTGKKITPKPQVKLGGKKLKRGRDYTLSYKNNKNAGTATIIIKGKGSYSGKKTVTFKIFGTAPAKRSSSSSAGPSQAQTVYATNTGSCYHRDGCSSLRRSRIPMSRSEAVASGLRPCKNCRP